MITERSLTLDTSTKDSILVSHSRDFFNDSLDLINNDSLKAGNVENLFYTYFVDPSLTSVDLYRVYHTRRELIKPISDSRLIFLAV